VPLLPALDHLLRARPAHSVLLHRGRPQALFRRPHGEQVGGRQDDESSLAARARRLRADRRALRLERVALRLALLALWLARLGCGFDRLLVVFLHRALRQDAQELPRLPCQSAVPPAAEYQTPQHRARRLITLS